MARSEYDMDIDPLAGPSRTTKDVGSDGNDSNASYYDWLADTATTCHITNQRNALRDYREEDGEIEGIGETVAKSLGRGTATLISRISGKKHAIHLNNVCYVPRATNSLLSISLFDESSGTITVKNGI